MHVAERPNGDDEQSEDREEPSVLGAATPLTVGRETRKKGGGGAGPRRFLRRGFSAGALIAVVVVAFAFVPLVASAFKKTPRDKIGLSYGGGPIEGEHFQRVVKPGSGLFFNGLFDDLYLYPAGQLNYIVSKQKNEGSTKTSDSVVAPSRDRVQIEYQLAVYYRLNTDKLREFHENIGLRYQAYTADGWDRLIRDTLRQQIENTLQQETRRREVAELFSDAELLISLQDTVQAALSDRLAQAMGDRYFCAPTFRPGQPCEDPTFAIKKVEVPASVVTAFESNRTSEIQIQTRQNEIEQRRAEAQGIEALNEALSVAGENYVLLKAIESGKISFWVLPSDSGLTLTSPDSGASEPVPPASDE